MQLTQSLKLLYVWGWGVLMPPCDRPWNLQKQHCLSSRLLRTGIYPISQTLCYPAPLMTLEPAAVLSQRTPMGPAAFKPHCDICAALERASRP